MHSSTLKAFLDEVTKIASTALSKCQYERIYGPKVLRKGKKFIEPGEKVPASDFQAPGSNDPVNSASRVGESRETPGGPL